MAQSIPILDYSDLSTLRSTSNSKEWIQDFNVNLDTKNLRKAAFAVGFGLTVGKAIGDLVSVSIDGTVLGVIKSIAKDVKSSQKAFENDSVKHAEEKIGNDPK